MSFNRKVIKNFDFGVLLNIIIICIIGLVSLSSATQAFNGGSKKLFITQIIWIILGLGLLIVTLFIDYNIFKMYYKVIYIVNVLLLLVLIPLGTKTNGARSWIGIGSVGIQPSEFIKLSLIIVFAKKIQEFEGDINNFKNLGILFIYAIIPIFLIYKQPDLGTAMVIVVIIIGMLFMAGLDIRVFIIGIIISAALVAAVWYSPVNILRPHQRDRIMTLFNPEIDPMGNGYHIIQSEIAIGSGQLLGMGLGKGLQNEGKFLPEAYTDFIFSVFAEEFGFVGAIILIVLYASFILKCIKISLIAKDKFGFLVIYGVVFMFAFQIFQNIAMTIGLMPITGITLPFVSYGGSSMMTSMIAVGLVLNIGMRRHKINF